MRRTAGFTLIELMVAFTILVMIMIELGRIQGIAGKMLTRSRDTSPVEVEARARQLLAEDCRNFVTPGWLTAKDPAIKLTTVESDHGSNATLSFWTVQYAPVTMPCVGQVTYQLVDGAGLVRSFVPALPPGDEASALTTSTVMVPQATGLEVYLTIGTAQKRFGNGVGLPDGVHVKVTYPLSEKQNATFEWQCGFKADLLPGT